MKKAKKVLERISRLELLSEDTPDVINYSKTVRYGEPRGKTYSKTFSAIGTALEVKKKLEDKIAITDQELKRQIDQNMRLKVIGLKSDAAYNRYLQLLYTKDILVLELKAWKLALTEFCSKYGV